MKSDRTLTAWGSGSSGQTNTPPGLSNVIAIAASGDHNLAIVGSGAPAFIRQSPSKAVPAGTPVRLSVAYVSSGPLHYQWRFNGVVMVGATNATLVLPNPGTSASGNYDCIVTGSTTTLTNSPITLTVLRTIPRFPTSPTMLRLTGSRFSVELSKLSGHGPITLYSSTNLIDWHPILTNSAVVGTLELVDRSATNVPVQYYRAMEE